jgi:DNA-binding NtrC family response regulator
MPQLLAIVELGGYPNLIPLYRKLGFRVEVVNSQRKARGLLKKSLPEVIVAEYIFQSDFRDRTSNLETLMAVLQRHPEVRVIVFYLPEQAEKLAILEARFPLFAKIAFPITAEKVEPILLEARDAPDVRS